MPKLNEIIGEEAFKSLHEDVKAKYKDIDFVDSSNYVEKQDLETANNTIKQYKKDITKRDQDLEELKGKVKNDEELTGEIERLKTENATAAKLHEEELTKYKFETKLEKVLVESGVKNVKALKALLDMDKIKLVDDTFIGLEEQIKAYQESDGYLFETESKGGTGTLGAGDPLGGDKGQEASIGDILAKAKTENSNAEAQNKFFS